MAKLDAFKEIIQTNAPTTNLTWLRLGGPLEFLARPRSEDELARLLKARKSDGVEARVLGEGASLLVSDDGAPGLAIQLSEPSFTQIAIDGANVVVGAGAKLGRLVTSTASAGLSGLEGLVGVPGSVGGAIVTNASTNDVSLGQWADSVRIATYDGEIVELSREKLVFGYRSSNLDDAIVLSVSLRLEPDAPEEIAKRLQKLWIVREQSRPNCEEGEGYSRVFKNPRGQNAADLVAEAGVSGARIGGAIVCETNPNLVKTSPNCTAEDARRLIALVQTQILEKTGIQLESELVVW